MDSTTIVLLFLKYLSAKRTADKNKQDKVSVVKEFTIL